MPERGRRLAILFRRILVPARQADIFRRYTGAGTGRYGRVGLPRPELRLRQRHGEFRRDARLDDGRGRDYEITNPVVRFGKDDYYDNLLRGEIGLRIYPTLSDTLTLALKLIYTHPANEERFRLHDRTVLTLRPIFPSE